MHWWFLSLLLKSFGFRRRKKSLLSGCSLRSAQQIQDAKIDFKKICNEAIFVLRLAVYPGAVCAKHAFHQNDSVILGSPFSASREWLFKNRGMRTRRLIKIPLGGYILCALVILNVYQFNENQRLAEESSGKDEKNATKIAFYTAVRDFGKPRARHYKMFRYSYQQIFFSAVFWVKICYPYFKPEK